MRGVLRPLRGVVEKRRPPREGLADKVVGGTAGDANNRGPFKLVLASTGLGQIYPYRIAELDAFQLPSTKIIDITSTDELKLNMTGANGVVPPAVWGTTPKKPGGDPGNQFLLLRFSHDLRISSVLSALPANRNNSGLTGAIQIMQYDPMSESQSFVKGRAFVGGKTYYDNPSTPGFDLELVQAVSVDEDGNVTIKDARAAGFPTGFTGDGDLVSEKTLVFIPDFDEDMTTFETFPVGQVIRLLVTSSVMDLRDKPVVEEVCTATTVGADTIAPQVLGFSKNTPEITPGNGELGVDPTTTIQVNFSKPIQPFDVGQFFRPGNLTPPARGMALNVTIANHTSPVLYYADPRTASDFCTFIVRPAFFFPGNIVVQVSANNTAITSIAGVKLGLTTTTQFQTGKGPGLVNAPVAPEAIYVGRGGTSPGVSVIDCNGFGQGTGDVGDTYPSRLKMNPNLGAPGVNPSLTPGLTNMDAGGAGIFTLTRDTNLSTLLIDSSVLAGVEDIHIGPPLDKVFNNENINPNTTRANQVNPNLGTIAWGNTISVAPVPNPPKLVFPPPNPGQNIWCEEPAVTSSGPPWVPIYQQLRIMTNHPPVGPCAVSPMNRLGRGDPFSDQVTSVGIYGGSVQGIFHGPQPQPGTPQPPTPFCAYTSRQQIGHFLYVLDRQRRQVLIVNSNRMQVLETIKLSDPYDMAVSPNLRRLAVTNFAPGTVTFVDTDPQSPTFHTIVGETRVGDGPTQCAWQPQGEDLLVLNSTGSSMSIIGGADLKLRKTVTGQLNRPIDVGVTSRQMGFGFATGTYFAYVLNRDGSVAVFESGPDGTNGIGFDDFVGVPEQATFRNGRRLMADTTVQASAIWVGHTDETGLGQVSHLELTSSQVGPIPINAGAGGFILPPTFRQREWTITGRIGGRTASTPIKDTLSGNSPIDMTFDDIFNNGALTDQQSNQISNLIYADHSGKSDAKVGAMATIPRFLFVAMGDTGKIDIMELDTGKRIKTIDCPGVKVLSGYWRQ